MHLRPASAGLPAKKATIMRLSRIGYYSDFGVYPAITAGLASARGSLFAMMAADLQEPPELIAEMRRELETGQFDVVVGTRAKREDPFISRVLSATFWKAYKLLVQREIPSGGVDVFGCAGRIAVMIFWKRYCTLAGRQDGDGGAGGQTRFSNRESS